MLNDLIEVNGLRIWNYQFIVERPSPEINAELHTLFGQIIDQRQRLQKELEVRFVEMAQEPSAGRVLFRRILPVWNVVKSSFPDDCVMPLHEFLDKGERAVLGAYDYAAKLPGAVKPCRELIAEQRPELTAFYKRYEQLYKEGPLMLLS